jgi:exo-1,4-beta-D-glucosaminidase
VGSDQGVITEVELVSEISGSSGMKMLGPYAYTPPVYWYTDKNFGGAYGFNTETSPGANVPPLESIKKMIPPDHLWPVDEVWEYHCGKNVFRTLDRFITAVERRYGAPEGVEEFAFKAQLLNYELMRPMFEAFQVNKKKAMGVVQWMLNSAWPNMYWQLYDSYLMPNGAFYATRNACRPLHLAYNYGDRTVHIINDRFIAAEDLTARIRVLDLYGCIVTDETLAVACEGESAAKIFDLKVPGGITSAYFLDLRLLDVRGAELDRNFYWLSTVEDVLDYEYEFEEWPFYTPSKQYADYTALGEMPQAELEVLVEKGQREQWLDFMVELTNRSETVAFFTELALVGEKSGLSFLPVQWEDNYVSLLPGETRRVKVSLKEELPGEERPVLRVRGWNVEEKEWKVEG